MARPLEAIRARMAQENIHALYVPSTDHHGSEYVGAHFAARQYLSGFTGSAGTLLVLADWAGLWTDGRYFLQAERELSGSCITLMRQGLADTPTVEAVMKERLQSGQCLAFDGRCVSLQKARSFKKNLAPLGIQLKTDLDLVGEIWQDRPALSAAPAWLLEPCYTGEDRRDKLQRVRAAVKKLGAEHFLISSIEEIAWLLNLRGGDIACTPVVLSYLALSEHDAILFVNPQVISPQVRELLEEAGVTLCAYNAVYSYVAALPSGSCVLMDGRSANARLEESLAPELTLLDKASPIEGFKAVKNPIEIENMKAAHVKDGIALTKFIYWLKSSVSKLPITEEHAAIKLEALRSEQAHYLGPSFSPIVAYGPHGAIVHYSATEETSIPLQKEGFVLVDSGGHYLEGTTDCTRTLALGPLSPEEKRHYTAVLRGNLNLASAQFLHGCTGSNLDYLARAPLWAMQLDYQHGTGHGVGYLLGVHEGPNQIRWRSTGGEALLEAGMITSNEPGLYLEGQYGIRLENLLLCVSRGESFYGKFLGFEPLTLVPFDLDGVDPTQMTREEIGLLNAYHGLVKRSLSPHLTEEERLWLSHATRPIAFS